jgi:hypothetical protein
MGGVGAVPLHCHISNVPPARRHTCFWLIPREVSRPWQTLYNE